MWKKDEGTAPANPAPAPEDRFPRREAAPAHEAPKGGGERASIGRSITIRGDVTGEEDLLIQGRVEGSVDLKQQAVVVGREGRVKANIIGRIVTVEGEVEGDLTAQEQVILRGSARVKGDITAPRVVLEDGANFRGLVDMSTPKETARGAPREEDRKPEPTRSGSPEAAKTSGSAPDAATVGKSAGDTGSKTGGSGKDASNAAEKAGS